jgi:hypothetical protein
MKQSGPGFGQAAGFVLVVLFFAVVFMPLPNMLARRLVVPPGRRRQRPSWS